MDFTPFLQKSDNNTLFVTDKYLWTKKEYKLPIKDRFEFKMMQSGDFVPLFSQNMKIWNSTKTDSDALSMYLSTKNQGFTFRTGIFKSDLPSK